ncbi:NAD(P)H-binding protein [Leifsonia shinshuensis]|uniref:SDR family oxidoreductase n=1 Tax=Leifsonia shinshuensis TaxID=150026 RepID=UPI001F505451|nr:NAD(P)H-binding protein [Leifsonia shinshuensis]MCI0157146.1 NAD(P)H-binding protein [Leifsonia shinshuensis]
MRVAVAGGTGVVGVKTVDAVRASGHEPVVLSRSAGVDLLAAGTDDREAERLARTLDGCAAVVDVTSVMTTSAAKSTAFFETVTRALLTAERAAGVPHHVALSIIGAEAAPAAYYAGKAAQERAVMASGTGWTLLRATQFHEFAAQLAARGGGIHLVPAMRSQPVAAAEVGVRLAELATADPSGVSRDLAGPRVEDMPTLVRRYLAATGRAARVLALPLPGRWGRALRDGTLLPGPDAQLGTATFDEWLATAAHP